MEEIIFHHALPIQLRFNGVDKFDRVSNAVYFSFYGLGKTEYFSSICPGIDQEGVGIVVIRTEADFVKQIPASDHIVVRTAISKIGTKNFHLVQQVIDTKTSEVKCICKSIMITFNLERHESMLLTKEWIETICKHEGRDLREAQIDSPSPMETPSDTNESIERYWGINLPQIRNKISRTNSLEKVLS